jgi:hypothetical protein
MNVSCAEVAQTARTVLDMCSKKFGGDLRAAGFITVYRAWNAAPMPTVEIVDGEKWIT